MTLVWGFLHLGTIHILTQQKSGWPGSEKWQLFLMYSTISAEVGGWVDGPKKDPKHADVINGWSLS